MRRGRKKEKGNGSTLRGEFFLISVFTERGGGEKEEKEKKKSREGSWKWDRGKRRGERNGHKERRGFLSF